MNEQNILIQDAFNIPGIGKRGEFLIDKDGNCELSVDGEVYQGTNIHLYDFTGGLGRDRERER